MPEWSFKGFKMEGDKIELGNFGRVKKVSSEIVKFLEIFILSFKRHFIIINHLLGPASQLSHNKEKRFRGSLLLKINFEKLEGPNDERRDKYLFKDIIKFILTKFSHLATNLYNWKLKLLQHSIEIGL